ncbi:unnamed protein product [Didymodactylos carnosus]|uniref:SnoaL-like domain-containing protein n=1 Tax=Didymodactylos carnosus TaxID=1234261 RepID=A0A815H6K6_9BILA|nr:unnamed protein product [Didymodactylos carnosus]CAF1350240.1 unnamed protein product [Didymodactylos carnosus]CAF3771207.1 unnamed protein product [Didymodactylos carnosus]CAF4219624.1 unnamed protein product [Didymodactylos carnosus]
MVQDVLDLYNSNPTDKAFRHYDDQAQFEDPLQFSGNLSSVKSAFKALPKVFEDSTVVRSDADIESNPDLIQISLRTIYKMKIGGETTMDSVVLLSIKDNKIIRHEERWNGEEIPNKETSFLGRIRESLRHVTGKVVHTLVDPDKEPKK